MKIAQVSPLVESVPPVRYGGTERIVFYLTEELVELGHDVTLFASADSITNARLIPGADQALRHGKTAIDTLTAYMTMLENVVNYSPEFDIIHFHTGHMHYALTRYIQTAHLTTHHDCFDASELNIFYREFNHVPVVSVSDNQRKMCPKCNWKGTVHYGIPENLYHFSPRHDSYLAFLGRISPDKGVLDAIKIAQRLNMNLKIAAKVDSENERYFNDYVKPLLKDPRIEFVGEINNTIKNYFLGDAYALLLPVQSPEPFEIVAIEALACGAPVVAYDGGAIGEIIQNGENGYIVDDIDSAVIAIEQLENISRLKCRQSFENRFTSMHMVNKYLSIYESRISELKPEMVDMHGAGCR